MEKWTSKSLIIEWIDRDKRDLIPRDQIPYGYGPGDMDSSHNDYMTVREYLRSWAKDTRGEGIKGYRRIN